MSTVLPSGWSMTNFESVVNLNPKNILDDDLTVGFSPMAMLPKNYFGKIKFNERAWAEVKKGYTQFQDNDVLFAKVTPCFENGKAVLVSGLPNGVGAGSTEYFVLRPAHPEISAKYLLALVKSRRFMSGGVVNMTGSVGLKRVPKHYVLNYSFPIPPAAEQARITQKFDQLLAQVDTLKTRVDAIPSILKKFRQSVLAAAVSGKLTEEWRSGNKCTLVDNTLGIIRSVRIEKAKGKAKKIEIHLKSEEYDIPSSWSWVSLDLLSSKIVDGVHHKPVYTETGIPFLSVKDIKDGKLTFDFCKCISQETHDEISKRCNPEKGDLLITKSGTIGRIAIIKTNKVFDLFVSVALIKPVSRMVNMEYIEIVLNHWVNTIDVSSRIVGSTIKNLHLRDMRVLAVPFSPIEEQKEIVRRVEHYFALADKIEAKVAAAQKNINHFTQSILAKAFRGELVPQDPNDEPASELLQRIKAEREAQSKPKAKTPKKRAK